jgi:AcrR family transcriptional regulator
MAQETHTRRPRLSRPLVLQAAVALADQDGLDGFSMRRLAQELGVVPMALYKHVANKDELLDGMVEIVFGEIESPSIDDDWRSAMRRRAISTREALRRHSWAIGMMETRSPGPANLQNHNAVMGCLREAGFSFQTAIHAYTVQDAYIYGFAQQEKTLGFQTPSDAGQAAQRRAQGIDALDEYPYLAEIAAKLTESGYDNAVEFAWGLDLILDGLNRRRRTAQT